MQDSIKVHVVRYAGRDNLVMRYVDPLTGKQITRSAKTPRRREAERAAGVWQSDLRAGRYQKPQRMTWEEFRDRYENEKLATLKPKTLDAFSAAANHLERIINPQHLARIDADVIGKLQSLLMAEGMKQTTLASHLRSIRAALNWAERRGLLAKSPNIEMPETAKGGRAMRGRPITGEEFDRLIDKVASVREHDPERWKQLLRGLWLSGLRLGEALQLSWDPAAAITVMLGGKYPKLRIFAEAQKSKRDAMLPISPEFAEFLLAIPEAERHGLVFKVEGLTPGKPMETKSASRVVSEIGEAAKIVIDPNDLRPRLNAKTGETEMLPRYATAHDLRRAFGTRWSKRVMPATLQKLMRHESIETTMKYYVEHSADDVSADIWGWQGSVLGSTCQQTETTEAADVPA